MSMSQTSDAHWPPRSPHEVLLSTPGGRDRLRRLANRTSPSPSPMKRSLSAAAACRNQNSSQEAPVEGVGEDDEDEEILQLQLQEIQARLKLKKLQKKAKQETSNDGGSSSIGPSDALRAGSVAINQIQSKAATLRAELLQRPRSQTQVHVPASPVRRARPEENPRSPGRVLLGIDKGLRGSDISLKRAPSLRRRPQDDVFQDAKRAGSFLQRTSSQAGSRSSADPESSLSSRGSQPMSFSEKLAAMRSQDTGREEREARRRQNRSKAFDIDHKQMEGYKQNACELPATRTGAQEFNREQVLASVNKPTNGLSRSKTLPSVHSTSRITSDSTDPLVISSSDSRSIPSFTDSTYSDGAERMKRLKVSPNEVPESEATDFEPYSSIHLSKRIIPHKVLARTFTGKKTFLIPDLLRIVKGPSFSGPDIEEDMVVLGVVACKSDPKSHQNTGKNDQRGKYMVLTLTDLKWELELFLFGSAFDQFYKIMPGTILALLNPTIMAPPRGKEATGKFSLTLNSSEDTVLEIGTARDLGYCKSIKKDNKKCDSWIDKRHTEYCDFHVNETLKKTMSKRMEINTMNLSRGAQGSRRFNSKDMTSHYERQKETELDKKTRYDRESHSQIFIGRSTAKLLDDADFNPDAFHRGTTKDQRITRALIAQEKERDLMDKLSKVGGGLGADYMRAKSSASSRHERSSQDNQPASSVPTDAASLGLLNGSAKEMHLSPIKRKRANTASSTSAVGWGNKLSKELGRMKDGENLLPVKKKTRFVTEKGIREAGRESLGDVVALADEDDDDLDIIQE